MDSLDTRLSDRRRFRRYPAVLDARLHVGAARMTSPATVVDLSEGGALVQVQQDVADGTPVTVSLVLDGDIADFPGLAVRSEDCWAGIMVHVQFDELNARDRLMLFQVLDILQDGYDEHQRQLSGQALLRRRVS